MKTTNMFKILFISLFSLAYNKPINLELGARPSAMGGAFVAIANDVNAAYWNPAGIVSAGTMQIGVSNQINQEFLGVNYNLVTGVIPVSDRLGFGFSWLMQNASLEEGDPENALDYREDYWREHHFALSFSYCLWKSLFVFRETSLGVSINRYSYSSEYYHGAGVGFDAAFRTIFPYGISMGLVARSVAADIEGEMFEPEYRVGLGYTKTFKGIHRLVIASDIAVKNDIEYSDIDELEAMEYNLKFFEGAEYSLLAVKDFVPSIRFGANMTPLTDRYGGKNINATGGIGLVYKNFRFDYAVKYSTLAEYGLGMSHQVSLILTK